MVYDTQKALDSLHSQFGRAVPNIDVVVGDEWFNKQENPSRALRDGRSKTFIAYDGVNKVVHARNFVAHNQPARLAHFVVRSAAGELYNAITSDRDVKDTLAEHVVRRGFAEWVATDIAQYGIEAVQAYTDDRRASLQQDVTRFLTTDKSSAQLQSNDAAVGYALMAAVQGIGSHHGSSSNAFKPLNLLMGPPGESAIVEIVAHAYK